MVVSFSESAKLHHLRPNRESESSFACIIFCSTITAAATSRSDSPDTEVPRMSGSLMKLSLASDLIGSPVLQTPPKSREGGKNMCTAID